MSQEQVPHQDLASIDLFAPAGLRLQEERRVDVELPPSRSVQRPGWMLVVFHAEGPTDVHADHWEVHPEGEEVVAVLTGEARLVLRAAGDRPERTVTVPAGTARVVPQGHWHRLEVDGPTDLLSVTPTRSTRTEAVG